MAKIRSIKQACEYIKELDNNTGVTEHAIRVMVKRGDIPCIKVGCKNLISVEKLLEFLERKTSQNDIIEPDNSKYNMHKIG